MKAILNDLIAEQSLVDSVLDGLTEEQWKLPLDGCKPWLLQDAVNHIAFFDYAAVRLMNHEFAHLLDGLDGLLTSVSMVDFATLAVLCGAASLGSLGVGCAAMCGACMAFLSRNAYPAQMFMGDTGSMFIGGAVVAAAMLLRQPLILVLIAFWMLMSSLSDIIQITYFKKTHGKRIFKMAPIHHHFELCGIHETKIVTMYIVTTAILCVITLLGVL